MNESHNNVAIYKILNGFQPFPELRYCVAIDVKPGVLG